MGLQVAHEADVPSAQSLGPVRLNELAAVELFGSLPRSALEELAARAVPCLHRAGETVLEEGEVGDSLYVVRRGVLNVVRPSVEPHLVLNTLRRGDAFGELAVLNSSHRLATVYAREAAETARIDKRDMEAVLDSNPQAVRAMLGALACSLTLAKEQVARHNRLLEAEVRERTDELRETHLEVINRLGQAAEWRDDATGIHITRMSKLAARLGRAAGLTEAESEMLMHAASLHDIGKIGIPDAILLKPGRLDEYEWERMKRHTTIGAELLSGSRSEIVRMAEVIARHHHERWDGSGYPDGLRGDQIPLVARICSVSDVFDALVSERPYKRAWSVAEALTELERGSGSQFEPRLVELFLREVPSLTASP